MENTLIKAESLNQKAHEKIKKAILQNDLPPGTRLVDSQLAEMFGISRTPVRDAMQMLVKEGLIEIREKRGYYVFSAAPDDINEIFDIRLMLDKEILRKIITVQLTADYAYFSSEIKKIDPEKVVKTKGSGVDFIKTDELFHDSIVALCGNSRFTKIYAENRNQMKVFRQLTSYSRQRMERVIENHKSILTAIKAMDMDLAVKITAEHLDVCRKEALEDFGHTDK